MVSLEGDDLQEAIRSSSVPGVTVIANCFVATLVLFSGLSQLFYGFQPFLGGLFLMAFSGVIFMIEFRVPREAHTYALFLFSFLGRGLFYIYMALTFNTASWFRIISAWLVFLVGLTYVVLGALGTAAPGNMNPDSAALGMNDEEEVI